MNPIETAAIPTAVAILTAFETLLANIGTDPAQAVAKLPGAVEVFLGTVEMQFPSLAGAEIGAIETEGLSKVGALITKLNAAKAAAAAPAA